MSWEHAQRVARAKDKEAHPEKYCEHKKCLRDAGKCSRHPAQYIVVRQGVYVQGVHGPWPTVLEARAAAQSLAQADEDSYHSWDVIALRRDGLGDEVVYGSYRKMSERLHAEILHDMALEAKEAAHRHRMAGPPRPVTEVYSHLRSRPQGPRGHALRTVRREGTRGAVRRVGRARAGRMARPVG